MATANASATALFEQIRRQIVAAAPDGTGEGLVAVMLQRAALAGERIKLAVTPHGQAALTAKAGVEEQLARLRAAGVETGPLETALAEREAALKAALVTGMALAAGELFSGPAGIVPLAGEAEA